MATKFICGFFPQYKLHKVCADDELRPVYGYIYFKNGSAYATNSYMAIAAPLSFVSTFSDEEQKLLEGKLIHATQFAQLLKMRETYVLETPDGLQFKCTTKAGETVIIPLLVEEDLGKFPNVESVLAEAEKNAKELGTQLPRLGFNTSLLANLAAAMDARIIEFYFTKQSGAIVVRGNNKINEIRAILMPCVIADPKF